MIRLTNLNPKHAHAAIGYKGDCVESVTPAIAENMGECLYSMFKEDQLVTLKDTQYANVFHLDISSKLNTSKVIRNYLNEIATTQVVSSLEQGYKRIKDLNLEDGMTAFEGFVRFGDLQKAKYYWIPSQTTKGPKGQWYTVATLEEWIVQRKASHLKLGMFLLFFFGFFYYYFCFVSKKLFSIHVEQIF